MLLVERQQAGNTYNSTSDMDEWNRTHRGRVRGTGLVLASSVEWFWTLMQHIPKSYLRVY